MRPHIALVTREVWPFVLGGGLGRAIRDVAVVLAQIADVTILTGASHREDHDRLIAGTERTWFDNDAIRFQWIEEPAGDLSPFWSYDQAWSASCHTALRELAARKPIGLIEFPDYQGSAAVTLNARRAGDDLLERVPVVVRLHTSWEMTQALDAHTADDLSSRTIVALERVGLRFADRLCSPGEETAAAFRRAYGDRELAPTIVTPMPFIPPAPSPDALSAPDGAALRLLFIGRLERRKGVDRLARAFLDLDRSDVELTFVGGDTPSGPGGGSMRAYLERLTTGNDRVQMLGFVDPDALAPIIRDHHVVVVPSLFESYGYVVREANAQNRPVLATPVGGLVDGITDGDNGWLTADTSQGALTLALADLAARRAEVETLIESGAARRAADRAADSGPLIAAYEELLAAGAPRAEPAATDSGLADAPIAVLVTAVAGDGSLADTLHSLRLQTTAGAQLIVAADDAMRIEPAQLPELSALKLIEPGADAETRARVAALNVVDPRCAICMLRAGDVLDARFMERCQAALRSDAAPAYVTTYASGRYAGRAPVGNFTAGILPENDAAGTIALFAPGTLTAIPRTPDPRAADVALFAELAASELLGAVIPEPLVTRVQRGSRRAGTDPQTAGMASGPAVWERQ